MSRKQQLHKLKELNDLILHITEEFNRHSGDLDEDARAQRFSRLQALQTAIVTLKKSLEQASPFAIDPVPGFNRVCEKLRGHATQEHIANMRLNHKACIAFQQELQGYEDELKKHGHSVNMENFKDTLIQMTEGFRRLGSKKLYEQADFSDVEKALTEHDSACLALREALNAAIKKLSALGEKHD